MTSDQVAADQLPSSGPATMTGQFGLSELHKGDVLAGRFRIENMLGIGGFGIVYRARDLSLEIDVALKVLRPELARRPESFERFRQELLLARQVSSIHVVRIHDIAQHDGRWFISMDFVDGQSLEQRLNDVGKLPTDEALKIVHGLLSGLGAAHQRGVVHRDLKPANILLDADGRAVITDFGVARSLGATGMTQSGIVVGTPEYLSPEQARGDSVDARSDLYAVGLMLHEMLTGALPFSGGTPAEMVMQRIVRPAPSLATSRRDLPHWLHAFSDRLLKVSPSHRFSNSQDALRALEQKRVPRMPVSRRAKLLVALVVSLSVGVGFWSWRYASIPGTVAAPVTTSVPRIALLPLSATDGDAEIIAMARTIDEHMQAWLRNDNTHAVAPRRRALDAIARSAPGMSGAALLRQLPEIARAANAASVLHGELRRDANGWLLKMDVWTAAAAPAVPGISIRGNDVASVYAAYVQQLPQLLTASGISAGAPPALPAPAIVPVGNALMAQDQHRAEAVIGELEKIVLANPDSAILQDVSLRSAEVSQQAAGQAVRDRIIKRFAQDSSALGFEIYARALIGNDQPEVAVQTLAKAVQQFPLDVALTLLDAQALNGNGDGANALAMLRRYVDSDDQDARALFALGRTAIEQGEAQAAVDDYLLRALVLDTRAGDNAAEAETRNALGVGYERLGQLEAASEQYIRAAAMREKLGDDEGLAKSLRNLAIVQAVRGDSAAADRSLDRVKKLLESRGDQTSLADLYNDRGVVAEERSDYAEAMKFYRQALTLRQQLNLSNLIAESLNNVGFCSYSLGDLDNASVYWQQALAQYKKLDDTSKQLAVEESFGLLDIARGHFKAARERLTAALQAAQDHQLPEEEAVAYTYLAELAMLEGRFTDALESADHAEQVFARRSDQRGLAEVTLIKLRIALELGDSASAAKAIAAIQTTQLSAEQHAAFLLAGARQASLSGDGKNALAKLDDAAKIGGTMRTAIGIRIQLERVRLALARDDLPGAEKALDLLSDDTAHIAEVPLRLEWFELDIAAALRAGKITQAASRYREAGNVLKTSGEWVGAALLHQLGAQALSHSTADAAAAHAAASAALSRLLAQTPASQRESLKLQIARKLREELGNDHGASSG